MTARARGFGYLIVAHHRPALLLRLVRAIRRMSDAAIVVHLDRRHRDAFRAVEPALLAEGRIVVIAAHTVRWAHFSQVEAELAGLAAMLDAFPDVTHVQHITGQDYPIRPLGELERMVTAQPGHSFIDRVPLPSPGREMQWEHVRRFYLTRSRRRSLRLPFGRRLPDLRFFSGSPYWCLAREHAAYLLGLPPERMRFYRGALSPDEFFFQTELSNSEHAGELLHGEYTFVDWPGDGPSPEILTFGHFDAMVESCAFFGRKFDDSVDTDVLDRIDQYLAEIEA
ncbi:beta-1,6-N-acetylglucosaminyltransferase [Novosphingobium sp. KCTC 2891]|uniref:beta-1,6-N-acetylglucosaminyltransferase n=1 Tax=Novosphingobium sp. KCTC 2891 TaxID=2989730 RepID=UPI002222A627|nr:beta-1,6-N-acetylglucosaminyltransferase [Novosphingobium sp. KCTC 2891]MCW1382708.1 beta-1,6-N-acetylglucosaminyltransferase [Novosphingobium sp. KCTC 2891]